ncbi:cytochrome oxidase biogenesis protein [Scheffersomyces coipomensis]|uniref:cytochrome oxidase biogenesis protein n=1 Tax=Scheffersomyces coipomensis TaxID=1788519 RepID=UPI00315CD523
MIRIGLSRSTMSMVGSRSLLSRNATLAFKPQFITPTTITKSMALSSIRFNSTNSTTTTPTISNTLPSFEEVNSSTGEIIDKITTTLHSTELGYLDSIGMAQGWGPTATIEKLLEITHVYTGLPWWGTIVCLTIGIRLILFPLYMKSSVNMSKMQKVKPQLDQIMNDVKNAETSNERYLALQERKQIMKSEGIKTYLSAAPLIQLPFAYGFFQALRKMANHPVEGFENEGYAWFQNLADVDPYLGLQGISAALIIMVIRFGGETGMNQQMAKPMKTMLTLLPIASIFITKNFSAAVVLYFMINSIFSLIQASLFKSSYFRKILKMPPMIKNTNNTKANQSMGDFVGDFIEKNKQTAITKARQTDKKLLNTKRKQLNSHGFIKRHDK